MARDKHKVAENVDGHIKKKEIVENHPTIASLATLFLQKGERDLQVATANFDFGKDEKNTNLKSAFFNWVVVISYYSMFHSARGALAKIKVYVSDDNVHEAVLNGMYHYYAYRGVIEKKVYYMLEDANKARDKAIKLIEKLELARKDRGDVNYQVAQAVIENASKKTLDNAKEFIEVMRTLIK